MRVIGIDPGLRNMGWGIIDVDGSRLSHVANGTCKSDGGADLAERLLDLFTQLSAVFATYRPNAAAVEQTFVNKDAVATLKLGQARGIALLVPAHAGIAVGEYLPNAVKKAVVGVGHADKRQIDHMVRLQLPGVNVVERAAAEKGSPLTAAESAELNERIAAVTNWLRDYAPEEARIAVRPELPTDAVAALSAEERAWLGALAPQIEAAFAADAAALGSGDAWQALIFSAAKEAGLQPVRAFASLYAAFLGRTNGPRAGWLLAALDPALVVTRLRAAAAIQ